MTICITRRPCNFYALVLTAAARCLQAAAYAAQPAVESLLIATFESPPYQITRQEEPGGTSVAALVCVLEKLRTSYQITGYPQKRAFQRLLSGRSDALLTVTPEEVIHASGLSLSQPLAFEKWVIYSRSAKENIHTDVDANYFGSLGVILGSSQERWLAQRNYPINHRVADMHILMKMLVSGRFDSVLVDYYQLQQPEYQAYAHDIKNTSLHFVKYSPKMLAFGKQFASENTGFIHSFNASTDGCHKQSMALEGQEKTRIVQRAREYLTLVSEDGSVVDELLGRNQFSPLQLAELERMESSWRDGGAEQNLQTMFNRVVGSTAAHKLRLMQSQSQGLLREIIITDKWGFNAVIAEKTSDFFQGDEVKFTAAVSGPPGGEVVSPIQYDASTAKFLVHVSFPMHDRLGNTIGVAIFGLDPEIALANRHLWGVGNNRLPGFAVDK